MSDNEHNVPEQRNLRKTIGKEVQPQPMDVLLGRGKSHSKHPGNLLFQEQVQSNQLEYINAHISCKKQITLRILRKIQETGRFIRHSNGGWSVVPDETARQKIAHAIQYYIRSDKERINTEENDASHVLQEQMQLMQRLRDMNRNEPPFHQQLNRQVEPSRLHSKYAAAAVSSPSTTGRRDNDNAEQVNSYHHRATRRSARLKSHRSDHHDLSTGIDTSRPKYQHVRANAIDEIVTNTTFDWSNHFLSHSHSMNDMYNINEAYQYKSYPSQRKQPPSSSNNDSHYGTFNTSNNDEGSIARMLSIQLKPSDVHPLDVSGMSSWDGSFAFPITTENASVTEEHDVVDGIGKTMTTEFINQPFGKVVTLKSSSNIRTSDDNDEINHMKQHKMYSSISTRTAVAATSTVPLPPSLMENKSVSTIDSDDAGNTRFKLKDSLMISIASDFSNNDDSSGRNDNQNRNTKYEPIPYSSEDCYHR